MFAGALRFRGHDINDLTAKRDIGAMKYADRMITVGLFLPWALHDPERG
jgi:hypothetical protein